MHSSMCGTLSRKFLIELINIFLIILYIKDNISNIFVVFSTIDRNLHYRSQVSTAICSSLVQLTDYKFTTILTLYFIIFMLLFTTDLVYVNI